MLPKGGALNRKAREIRSRALASDMGEDGGQKERGGDVLCGDPWGPLRAKAPYLITGSIALNSSVPAFSSTS